MINEIQFEKVHRWRCWGIPAEGATHNTFCICNTIFNYEYFNYEYIK